MTRTQYLLFLDESGTHDMATIDPKWPVFALVGLLVGEQYYAKTLVPRVKEFKKRHGLGEEVVLQSRLIRRCEGPYSFLRQSADKKQAFYSDLNELMANLRVRFHSVVINKHRLLTRFISVVNPYDVSLSQLLSLTCGPPRVVGVNRPNVVRIIAESRGKNEDKSLQKEYQGLRQSGLISYGAPDVQARRGPTVRKLFPERIHFVRKSKVVAGLELVDLAAYPIARAVLNQEWDNPAYVVISKKLRSLVEFP